MREQSGGGLFGCGPGSRRRGLWGWRPDALTRRLLFLLRLAAGLLLSWHTFTYDALSIKKQSFWLDLKLIALSCWLTFRGTWAYRGKKFSHLFPVPAPSLTSSTFPALSPSLSPKVSVCHANAVMLSNPCPAVASREAPRPRYDDGMASGWDLIISPACRMPVPHTASSALTSGTACRTDSDLGAQIWERL
jgi:hypothetical protein